MEWEQTNHMRNLKLIPSTFSITRCSLGISLDFHVIVSEIAPEVQNCEDLNVNLRRVPQIPKADKTEPLTATPPGSLGQQKSVQ